MRSSQTPIPKQLSDAQRDAVRVEMDSILSDPLFRKSQRCVSLFRGIVEHALAGKSDLAKERTLAVEVFGRDWNFDSSSDPIVRVVANDLRKRLAQYDQEYEPRHGVRIRLISGSYIPEFDFIDAEIPAPAEVPAVLAQSSQPREDSVTAQNGFRSAWHFIKITRPAVWIAGVGIVVVAASLLMARSNLLLSSQDQVWKPLLQQGNTLVICVADNLALQRNGVEHLSVEEKRIKLQRIADMISLRKAPAMTDSATFDLTTPYADVQVSHDVTSWLDSKHQKNTLKPSSALNLEDFRSRPVVLVGGFDNPWSAILLSGMRFTPELEPATGTFWVRDAQDPSKRDWARRVQEEKRPSVDYAIVTRLFDGETGNWVLAIQGLGAHGTEAASELILDPAYEKMLPREIRSAKNFQIVLSTQVINASTAPPQLLHVHTW